MTLARKSSVGDPQDEPKTKKMADNQILDAINGIRASVTAMEAQMRSAPTKADLGNIVNEIRAVREDVIRNTDRIDTLFDLRRSDEKILDKKLGRLIGAKMSAQVASSKGQSTHGSKNEQSFLICRRSIRMWPVEKVHGTDKAVDEFLRKVLIPETVMEGLTVEKIEPISQPRRSKVVNEVTVRFATSQQRDAVQSYAYNLAQVQGKAGIWLEVPDFLRGLFRQYEEHSAELRAKFGTVKRAIRFDDVALSLYMDVKLDDTEWHRISAVEMATIHAKKKQLCQNGPSTSKAAAERKKIFMQETQPDYPRVETDEEEFSDCNGQESSK